MIFDCLEDTEAAAKTSNRRRRRERARAKKRERERDREGGREIRDNTHRVKKKRWGKKVLRKAWRERKGD